MKVPRNASLLRYLTVFAPTVAIAAALLVAPLSGCEAKSFDTLDERIDTAENRDPAILTELPLDGGIVQLYLASCKDGNCPVQLRLIQGDHTPFTENLGWGASSGVLYQEPWTSAWQQADDEELPAYTLGEEYNPLTTAIQTFRKFTTAKKLCYDCPKGAFQGIHPAGFSLTKSEHL